MQLDFKLKNGKIIDGSGKEAFLADIGIKDGRIVSIGNLEDAIVNKEFNIQGCFVSPGFIDIHGHSDYMTLIGRPATEKIKQGVTTEIFGNCGFSMFPRNKNFLSEYDSYVGTLLNLNYDNCYESKKITNADSFFTALKRQKKSINVGTFIGHGNVRISVMGFANRKATERELETMKELIRSGMEAGALGLSSGLAYVPGSYTNTEELIELAKVVGKYNGIYTTHLRNECRKVLQSCQEAITIAEKADIHVNISHHKVMGYKNWGLTSDTLTLISNARSRGLSITCDQYPYKRGSTIALSLLPPWLFSQGMEEGLRKLTDPEIRKRIIKDWIIENYEWECVVHEIGWDNIYFASTGSEKYNWVEGLSVSEAALKVNQSNEDFFLNLLVEENGDVIITAESQWSKDLINVMKYPFTMFGSDGIYCRKPHPRLQNTFPRILGKYVRQEKILSIEEAIRKMTYLPAKTLGLVKRGLIKQGYWADLTVFSGEQIIDRGNYTVPNQDPDGIKLVMVNGEVTLEDGNFLDKYNGTVL